MQSVAITTHPALEPVSVNEAKAFLRVDITDDDDLIADLILAARGLAEEYTRRKFISTGITLTLDDWPSRCKGQWWDGVRQGHVRMLDGQEDFIILPYPPTVSVTSITTYARDNSALVYGASNYRLDTAGRIYLNEGAIWPTELRDFNAISIVYTAGYGATLDSVPAAIRHAIKLTVAAMYEDRQCFDMPVAAKAALQPYRVIEGRSNGM